MSGILKYTVTTLLVILGCLYSYNLLADQEELRSKEESTTQRVGIPPAPHIPAAPHIPPAPPPAPDLLNVPKAPPAPPLAPMVPAAPLAPSSLNVPKAPSLAPAAPPLVPAAPSTMGAPKAPHIPETSLAPPLIRAPSSGGLSPRQREAIQVLEAKKAEFDALKTELDREMAAYTLELSSLVDMQDFLKKRDALNLSRKKMNKLQFDISNSSSKIQFSKRQLAKKDGLTEEALAKVQKALELGDLHQEGVVATSGEMARLGVLESARNDFLVETGLRHALTHPAVTSGSLARAEEELNPEMLEICRGSWQKSPTLASSRLDGSATLKRAKGDPNNPAIIRWNQATELVNHFASSGTVDPGDILKLTKELNILAFAESNQGEGGVYRQSESQSGFMKGETPFPLLGQTYENFPPPSQGFEGMMTNGYIPSSSIPSEMNQFAGWLSKQFQRKNVRPAEAIGIAGMAYQWLLTIHPYGDANGRTSRLTMDAILQRFGLPPTAFGGKIPPIFLGGGIPDKSPSGTPEEAYVETFAAVKAACEMSIQDMLAVQDKTKGVGQATEECGEVF